MAGQDQSKLWYSYCTAAQLPANQMAIQAAPSDHFRPYANQIVRTVDLCWDLHQL
jgi:hypothetical protein